MKMESRNPVKSVKARKPVESIKARGRSQLKKKNTLLKKYKSRCPRCLQYISAQLRNKKAKGLKKPEKEELKRMDVDPKTKHIVDTVEKVKTISEVKIPTETANDQKSEFKNKLPLMYRWVAYVTEGPPGFSDSDECYGPWCTTREEAEEHMRDNVEKDCRKRFTNLRRIGRADIEDNSVEY